MRVHKPKVEYKLALQEKPQGSILAYYYKTNNLTRINWLNTRLIIASNKIRHEIPFKTKRVKYTAIWKTTIKIVKESKLSFFTPFPSSIFLFPPPQFYYFRSSFVNSLLHNCNIFPLFFYSHHHNFNIFPQFYYFPSSMLLFPPPQFYYFPLLSYLFYRVTLISKPIHFIIYGGRHLISMQVITMGDVID